MTQDVSLITEALRESTILEVRSDGVSVRTRENPTIWPINRAQEENGALDQAVRRKGRLQWVSF